MSLISSFSLAKADELKGDDFYDSVTLDGLSIAIVCDGVGSAENGALAAKRVTNYLITNFKNRPDSWSIEKSIKKFIKSINSILYQESVDNYQRAELITTLTIAVIEGNRLYGANVGDSRIYISRNNTLNQLSFDHSMDEKNYENVLTQAIGMDSDVEPYYFENELKNNDKILLCSDGLYNILNEELLIKEIEFGAYPLVKKASSLVKDNLPDDTTAIVIDIQKINHMNIKFLKEQKLIIPEYLNIGDVIDGYTLEKSLIQNNRTWIAKNKGIRYILKFPPYEALEDKNLFDSFVKEAWNAKRLKAGFFPKAVIPKNRTHRYYVMEALDGMNLKEYLKSRKLSIEESILLAKTLLRASQYLLKYDLVHGDIKPENIILLNRHDKKIFKIIDFGSITELYSLTNRAGTPSYLAPERFEGNAISEQSEIFAIGVTLFESLTDKFPYGEIEPFQNPTFKEMRSPNKINKNIPLWLDSIILRSLAIDTKQRYLNYTEMIYELENSDRVKPFFNKDTPLLERDPLKFYKLSFYILLILNIIQFLY